MYMALHIADPEVSRLATALAKLERTTKTEAVRRVLRQALAERRREAKRKGFREFALGIVAEARRQAPAPVSKHEMDELWDMRGIDGNWFVALLAVVLAEPDAHLYIDAIDRALAQRRPVYLPASALVEAGIVAETRNCARYLDALLTRLQPEVVPLDRALAELSQQVFRRFGRGRHQAKLNFGDCMSYATAEFFRLPLLFKGEDFTQTPVASALQNPVDRP
jgi:ribonuclease VapC